MAEVTGRIGDNDVSLDNAATETTLRALLLATTKSAKEMDKLLKLAAKAGMNPRDIEAANAAIKSSAAAAMSSTESYKGSSKSLNVLNKGLLVAGTVLGSLTSSALSTTKNFVGFADQLLQGQSSVASFALAFKDLPLGLGLLASVIGKVIAMQEEELETYRKLTSAGVNFAGDLTGIRQNALSLGLTLDQFGGLMANNTEVLARFGETANDGAKNFVKIASDLKKSPIGQQLLAMGVGFEQLSQGVMNYMKVSANAGGTQVKDTKAMSEAAGAYIKQQDMLARLTGKSVEEQQKALEKEAANAAWKNYLLTLDTKEREKAEHAYTDALQKGGVGAADALRSRMMNIPPMTEAGALFESMAENTSLAFDKLVEGIKNPSTSLKDMQTSLDGVTFALGKDGEKFAGPLGAALIAAGGELGTQISNFLGNLNRNIEQGMTTLEEVTARRIKQEQEQAEAANSNAGLLAKAQDELKKIGTELLNSLGPLLQQITPIVSDFVKEFKVIVDENMPAIKSAIQVFAESLKDFGKNMFTEEGRTKIVNDALYYLKLIWVSIKEQLPSVFGGGKENADEQRARLGIEKEKLDKEAEAARIKADLAAKSKALETTTDPSAKAKLQGEISGLQKQIEETTAAASAAAKRDQEIKDSPENSMLQNMGVDAVTGAVSGAMIGSVVPVVGTLVGAAIGTAVGGTIGFVRSLFQNEKKDVTPEEIAKYNQSNIKPETVNKAPLGDQVKKFSEGGIASGPETGYLAMLHGTEAVVPLGSTGNVTKEALPDIFFKAMSSMGQSASKMLDVPVELKDMIKKASEPVNEPLEETEASKSVIESSKQLENVTELLVKLNIQTAEMLEHIKISAEYDRRNLDALNEINPNAFIRA